MNSNVFTVVLWLLATLVILPQNGFCMSDDDRKLGEYIGKLNVYHHGVSGEIYAINETTILVRNFYYDGAGKDVYFYGGNTGTGPSLNGFIIPDQYGRTNVLQKAANEEFTLTLPKTKRVSELKWISVFDLTRLESYGDVYIPDGFRPPAILTLPPLISKAVHECNSGEIIIKDFKTLVIKDFNLFVYDDQVGKGHVPTQTGSTRIPDDLGYYEPLRRYDDVSITLILPGELTFDADVHWVAVYDVMNDKSIAYVNIPNNAHIPPSLLKTVKYDTSLPNCKALHRDFHVAWDVVGQTLTVELIALSDASDQWLGFGVSGSNNMTQMIKGDVAIGYLSKFTGQAVANDYHMDAKSPCSTILEHKRGVCLDSELGGSDSIQVLEGRRQDGVLSIKFRRQVSKDDEYDAVINATGKTPIIWAVGRLLPNGQPGFHRLYPKQLTELVLSSRYKMDECPSFVIWNEKLEIEPWKQFTIVDGKLRSFSARLGPTGGLRGYEGQTGMGSTGFAWYIQGFLTPALYMQRGVTYSFKVEGGNNPHSPEFYHPFVISNTPVIDNSRDEVILAGVETTRRGRTRPIAAGRLCMWSHGTKDRREDERFNTFEKFRNTLKLRCENGSQPAILTVTPNSSWPDVVYYHSYNGVNMGNRIYVLDQLSGNPQYASVSPTVHASQIAQVLFCLCLSSVAVFYFTNR